MFACDRWSSRWHWEQINLFTFVDRQLYGNGNQSVPSTQHWCRFEKAANLTYIMISCVRAPAPVCVFELCYAMPSLFRSVFSFLFYSSSLNKMEINWKEEKDAKRNPKLNQLTYIILTSRCMIPVSAMGQFILYLYIEPIHHFNFRSHDHSSQKHTPTHAKYKYDKFVRSTNHACVQKENKKAPSNAKMFREKLRWAQHDWTLFFAFLSYIFVLTISMEIDSVELNWNGQQSERPRWNEKMKMEQQEWREKGS